MGCHALLFAGWRRRRASAGIVSQRRWWGGSRTPSRKSAVVRARVREEQHAGLWKPSWIWFVCAGVWRPRWPWRGARELEHRALAVRARRLAHDVRGVLDHDRHARGEHELIPGLAEVDDVDAVEALPHVAPIWKSQFFVPRWQPAASIGCPPPWVICAAIFERLWRKGGTGGRGRGERRTRDVSGRGRGRGSEAETRRRRRGTIDRSIVREGKAKPRREKDVRARRRGRGTRRGVRAATARRAARYPRGCRRVAAPGRRAFAPARVRGPVPTSRKTLTRAIAVHKKPRETAGRRTRANAAPGPRRAVARVSRGAGEGLEDAPVSCPRSWRQLKGRPVRRREGFDAAEVPPRG